VIRTWRAVDACGNTGTQTQTITYSRDVHCTDIYTGAIGAIPCNPTQAQIDAAVAAPTVADNVQLVLQQHLLMVLSPVQGCARTMIRTWSAVDACGNTGTQHKQ
jgi:hypothetical protein